MEKTLEERLEMAKEILFGRPKMLMTKPLKEGSLKNKRIGNCCTGYTFELDNLSYRGVWISTLENIRLWVDGEAVSECDILVCLKGMKFPLCDLGDHTEVFWGATDTLAINVNRVGGLANGSHQVDIEIYKRADFGHSYGNGEEGYENAAEFKTPQKIVDTAVFEICDGTPGGGAALNASDAMTGNSDGAPENLQAAL